MYYFLLKAALSGIFGSAFGKWFLSTKCGRYFQNRLDRVMEYLTNKHNISVLKKDEEWMTLYPSLAARIERLESKINREE
jgi:hypothetical protein